MEAIKNCESKFIFITEGELDALSVIEAGGQAIALGSISNQSKFIETCKKYIPKCVFILSLDNDEAGQKAQHNLKIELLNLKLDAVEVNISGEFKDPNDALVNDRKQFVNKVKSIDKLLNDKKTKQQLEYINEKSLLSSLDGFTHIINGNIKIKPIKTGFTNLDDILGGGFYEGLYILGGLSSVGKTSFCLQLADQVAHNAHKAQSVHNAQKVIIFSLEMSRYELMAKSISRITREISNSDELALTSRDIMNGSDRKLSNTNELQLIYDSMNMYKNYAGNIQIYEGFGNIGVQEIESVVAEHISVMEDKPVVIIDYLQIFAPYDFRLSDKQNIDKSVLELKRMSRKYKVPVIVISSFNRDNYLNPVNMSSFKESGAIEYSSDVLIGMQLAGMDRLCSSDNDRTVKKNDVIKQIENWKKAFPRKIELKILKNRNGDIGKDLCFNYYSKFNLFEEITENSMKASSCISKFWFFLICIFDDYVQTKIDKCIDEFLGDKRVEE